MNNDKSDSNSQHELIDSIHQLETAAFWCDCGHFSLDHMTRDQYSSQSCLFCGCVDLWAYEQYSS